MKKFFAILCGVFFLIAPSVQAAEFYFGAPNQVADLEAIVEIGVFLNSEGESINTLEGYLSFPETLEPVMIKDGDSLISFWLERPAISTSPIRFTGLIPGGFIGDHGYLFSIVFKTKAVGVSTVSIDQEKAFLNDGLGTAVTTRVSPLKLEVLEGAEATPFLLPDDRDPPESFAPVVGRVSTSFDGQWFVSFATQDKGSGIDHYEVVERPGIWDWHRLVQKEEWQMAKSPYVLQDQELRHDIYVKAVDQAGNERVERLLAEHSPGLGNHLLTLGILLVIIIVGVFLAGRLLLGKLWRKYRRP